MDERELVTRARKGDQDALSYLVEKYRLKMFNLAYGMTRNREEADDLTQDVFVKAWRHLPGFKGRSTFGTWLYRIAVNTIRDHLRKERRVSLVPLEENILDAGTGVDVMRDNEEAQEQLRQKARLHQALNTLPEKFRMILSLREIQGLSYDEIAGILKISPGTVDSRLFRARRRLRAAIAEQPQTNGGDHAL